MIFRALLSRLTGPLLIALGTIAGGLLAFWNGYLRGIEKREAEQRERERDQLEKRADIAEDIAYLGDSAVDDELREYIKDRDKRVPPGAPGPD